MRTWLMGFKVVCDPTIRAGHMFIDEHPYHITKFEELYNKVRFAKLTRAVPSPTTGSSIGSGWADGRSLSPRFKK